MTIAESHICHHISTCLNQAYALKQANHVLTAAPYISYHALGKTTIDQTEICGIYNEQANKPRQ